MVSKYLRKQPCNLTPNQQFYKIVEDGMCIGCGLCESVVGAETICLELVANGFERPVIQSDMSQSVVDTVWACCPGTHVEGLPKSSVNTESNKDLVWGVWRDMYYAYSAEPQVRHLASTGGLLTGLALYLLESRTVDFILHAKASEQRPSFGEPFISRIREDVFAAAGSRYGPTATLKHVVETLHEAQRTDQRFVFIGTPCDVSALRNYAKLDQRVDQYCYAMLTMVCGGFMAPAGLNHFLEQQGIELSQITKIRYRGYGCPGSTTVTTADGQTTEISYLDFWGEDDSGWQLPTRCKVCPDGIGEAADIAASDVWEGGAPTQQEIDTDLGTNGAVVRSLRGEEIMNAAIEAGYLVRGQALTPADMNRFQPHQEAKKRAAWSRFQGMKDAGKIVPDTKRLRLKALAKKNSKDVNKRQRAGTRQRAEQGKLSEATPRLLAQPD